MYWLGLIFDEGVVYWHRVIFDELGPQIKGEVGFYL